jgi:hypothetical protein
LKPGHRRRSDREAVAQSVSVDFLGNLEFKGFGLYYLVAH